MAAELPEHINYWMTAVSKHDCFFNVGPESGPKKKIGAIQILIIGHSEVLRRMLDESPLAEKEEITVVDSDPGSFNNFLRCIYGGTDMVVRKITYEECINVLYLCEKYLTLEVKEKIASLIMQLYEPLSIENVLKGLSNPAFLASDSLEKAVSKVVQNKTNQILEHELFLDLEKNAIVFIVKQHMISINEIDLWKAVLNWGKKNIEHEDVKELRSHLMAILKHIRFCTMKSDEFCSSVVPSKILTPEEVFEICISIGTCRSPILDGLCCSVLNRCRSSTSEIKFSFIVNNIKEFTGSTESPKIKLEDFYWNIMVQNYNSDEDEDNLGIYINCSSANHKSPWKRFAEVEVSIVNHGGGCSITRILNNTFTNKKTDWGYKYFTSFKDVVKIERGYIKNNAIEVVAHVWS